MKTIKHIKIGLFFIIFFSLFFFAFPAGVRAADWYVDTAATGSNNGTSWTNAWTGLSAIVWSSVNPGDTVYLSGGTVTKEYTGGITYDRNGTAGALITIDIGANSPDPVGHSGEVIINGTTYCLRVNGDFNHIKNLTCQGASISGFRLSGTDSIIENTTVGNSYDQGIQLFGCNDCIVRGNRISTPDDLAQQTDGIAIYNSSDTIIEKNWVKITNQNNCGNCHHDGIQANFTVDSVFSNITIRYNYVENTKAATSNAQGIYVTFMQGDVKIIGNIVTVPVGGQAVAAILPNTLPQNISIIGNTISSGGYWGLHVQDDNPIVKNNIIRQTGGSASYIQNGALVRLDGLSGNDPANVDYNTFLAPYTGSTINTFYVEAAGKTWDTWRTTYGLDANSSLSSSSTLDSCLRPTGTVPPLDSGVTLAAEYDFGLSASLCGNDGADSFLPVTITDRSSSGGSAWDIGAYEFLPITITINQKSDQPDPVNSSPINFTVVFSESVSGFEDGDISLSGTAGATTATVTGSGTTYDIAVSGMTGDGTVIVSVAAGAATGVYGNTNTASTSTDNTVLYRASSIAMPGPSSSWCGNFIGTVSPNLFEIHTTGTTATLYFAPPSMPYSTIYISYTEKPGVLQHGVEYAQGFSGGALKFKISDLKPNTTYYFTVRSGNGCATGAWGNTLSAKTTSLGGAIRRYYKWTPIR